jgi:hypothetical protein
VCATSSRFSDTRNMSPDPSRDRQVSRKSARPPSHDDTDQDEHYLTAAYGGHGAPIVVAVVGLSATGKTELIRAMFDQLSRGWALSAHGLSVDWIGSRHGNTGATAAPNADVTPWPEYAETVLLWRHDQAAWLLTFLEIAEADVCSLETPDNGRRPSSVRAGRALLHADAFMFVHEPQLLEATAATVSACNSAVTQALAYRKARDADPS